MNETTTPMIRADPINRRHIPINAGSVSTVYSGALYVFESRENRDAFEREPEKYLGDGIAGSRPSWRSGPSSAPPASWVMLDAFR